MGLYCTGNQSEQAFVLSADANGVTIVLENSETITVDSNKASGCLVPMELEDASTDLEDELPPLAAPVTTDFTPPPVVAPVAAGAAPANVGFAPGFLPPIYKPTHQCKLGHTLSLVRTSGHTCNVCYQ